MYFLRFQDSFIVDYLKLITDCGFYHKTSKTIIDFAVGSLFKHSEVKPKMNAVSSVLENNGLRDVLGLSLSYLDPGDLKEAFQVSR